MTTSFQYQPRTPEALQKRLDSYKYIEISELVESISWQWFIKTYFYYRHDAFKPEIGLYHFTNNLRRLHPLGNIGVFGIRSSYASGGVSNTACVLVTSDVLIPKASFDEVLTRPEKPEPERRHEPGRKKRRYYAPDIEIVVPFDSKRGGLPLILETIESGECSAFAYGLECFDPESLRHRATVQQSRLVIREQRQALEDQKRALADEKLRQEALRLEKQLRAEEYERLHPRPVFFCQMCNQFSKYKYREGLFVEWLDCEHFIGQTEAIRFGNLPPAPRYLIQKPHRNRRKA